MSKTHQPHATNLVVAAGVGALLMYLLDPAQGRRRVALARDKVTRIGRKTSEMTDAGLRDLANRAAGIGAELRGATSGERVSDEVLVERVRARLGRSVSHPRSIEVSAASGCVTVSGPVLEHEVEHLLRALESVRGVRQIENRLDVHATADHVPALQGGNGRPGPRHELLQSHWAPGPRLLTLAGGVALACYGLGRRGLSGTMASMAGAALATRAATNQTLARTVGVGAGRRAVDIEKTIHIDAPPERVFDLWSQYEDFPRFMSRVEQVDRLDDTRSHWVVRGLGGRRLEWNSVITEHARPHVLAWHSEPGSPVQHAGHVRLQEENGGTRVTVRMSYNPPGGALGHSLAAALGRDPKQHLDADLMRMKSFLETGVAPHDAARPPATPGAPPDLPRPGALH